MKELLQRWIFLVLCFILTAGCFSFLVLRERHSVLDYDDRFVQGHVRSIGNTFSYNLHYYAEHKMSITQFEAEQEPEKMEPEQGAPVKTFIFHKVRNGDTLWKIALMYDSSIEALVIDNDIHNPDIIFQGTVLKIRKGRRNAL
jgi:LysM repeat protein